MSHEIVDFWRVILRTTFPAFASLTRATSRARSNLFSEKKIGERPSLPIAELLIVICMPLNFSGE